MLLSRNDSLIRPQPSPVNATFLPARELSKWLSSLINETSLYDSGTGLGTGPSSASPADEHDISDLLPQYRPAHRYPYLQNFNFGNFLAILCVFLFATVIVSIWRCRHNYVDFLLGVHSRYNSNCGTGSAFTSASGSGSSVSSRQQIRGPIYPGFLVNNSVEERQPFVTGPTLLDRAPPAQNAPLAPPPKYDDLKQYRFGDDPAPPPLDIPRNPDNRCCSPPPYSNGGLPFTQAPPPYSSRTDINCESF